MKRLFILASAAIVALASCSKTQVVYNDAPEEIGFKAVTGAMTKAVQTTDVFTQTIGVIAYNHDATLSSYFPNAEFTKTTVDGVTTWNGSKFWPIGTTLDFMVYSPYQVTGDPATVVPTNTADSKQLVVTVADNDKNSIEEQVDYMYGDTYLEDKDKNSTLTANFKHALTQVTVNFTGSENVTLNSAILSDTAQDGTYTVQYLPAINPMISWVSGDLDNDLTLKPTTPTQLNATAISTSYLVVPTVASAIDINYTMAGGSALDKNIDLNETWVAGSHYTYNVYISANEIKFKVTVTPMATGTVTSGVTIE